ncbi:MAG: hypothetical protein WCF20_04630 [Methylovirgula sp.]
MMKMISTIAAAGFMLAGVAFDAQAMPAAPMTADQGPEITPIASTCPAGFYRGPHGGCVRGHVLHCVVQSTSAGARHVCS